MADEVVIPQPPEHSLESPADPPVNKPGIPADDMEITLADGSTVTYGELREGYTRMEDYTVKTQEAADIKRQADEQMAEAAAIKAEAEGDMKKADDIRQAVNVDVQWYRDNPDPTQWENYRPEVDQVVAGTPSPSPSPISTPPASAMPPPASDDSELKGRVENLEKTANEKAVDILIADSSRIAGSAGNELVTQKQLLNAVRVFQAENTGEIPTSTELTTLAKGIQEDLVSQGIPVPLGTVPPNGSTKPNMSAGPGVELNPAWKDYNLKKDKGKITDALGGFMRDLAARNG
jgi:hypothetical protein